jgi:hypothetical protein
MRDLVWSSLALQECGCSLKVPGSSDTTRAGWQVRLVLRGHGGRNGLVADCGDAAELASARIVWHHRGRLADAAGAEGVAKGTIHTYNILPTWTLRKCG